MNYAVQRDCKLLNIRVQKVAGGEGTNAHTLVHTLCGFISRGKCVGRLPLEQAGDIERHTPLQGRTTCTDGGIHMTTVSLHPTSMYCDSF